VIFIIIFFFALKARIHVLKFKLCQLDLAKNHK